MYGVVFSSQGWVTLGPVCSGLAGVKVSKFSVCEKDIRRVPVGVECQGIAVRRSGRAPQMALLSSSEEDTRIGRQVVLCTAQQTAMRGGLILQNFVSWVAESNQRKGMCREEEFLACISAGIRQFLSVELRWSKDLTPMLISNRLSTFPLHILLLPSLTTPITLFLPTAASLSLVSHGLWRTTEKGLNTTVSELVFSPDTVPG